MRHSVTGPFDPDWTRPADPLSAVMLDLRLAGSFFCIAEFRAPWAVALPAQTPPRFHFVAEGSCFLRHASGATRLESGDLVLVPRGEAHVLSEQPDGPGVSVESLPLTTLGASGALLQHGGIGARTVLLCTKVECHGLLAQMLMRVMPAFVHVRAADHQDDVLRPVLEAMTREVRAARPGSATVLTRFADILVINAIRSWLQTDRANMPGWLMALRDPQVGRSIAIIHERPEDTWSVAALARAAAMSRSAFAKRFLGLVGLSPMHYVTRVRMHRAHAILQQERISVAALADRLGYESESAFSRAFKRHIGIPPGGARRQSEPRPAKRRSGIVMSIQPPKAERTAARASRVG